MAEGGPKARLSTAWALLRDPKRLWRQHKRLVIAAGVALVLAVAGAIVAYDSLKRPADVHNPNAVFKPEKPKRVKKPQTVNWPLFGYDRARTRYLPVRGVSPPFRKLWRFTDRPLLEFPPIYVGGKLYFVNNSGYAYALDADTGKTIWKRNLPGRAESSPLVIGRSVYFGCEDGNLYSLSTISGDVRWATALGGPIKSAPAYKDGKLYVGDYGGYMNAVDAETGELKWQSGSLGPGFGGTGAFYSSPAVAFGRVYAGNNDSRIYSFDSSDGTLAWSYSTGGYAYSGPSVATTRHSPPTVYIGSFDGNVYALDAKDGSVRWSRSAGGQVIGSLSAVGDIVYAAEFTHKTTSGFMMRSGRRVFRYPKGTYTPVISDGRRLYLTGYSSITALAPFRPKAKARAKGKRRGASASGSRRRPAGAAVGAGRPARTRGR